MKRIIVPKRKNWEERVAERGLTFHSRTGPYWNEGICYSFTSQEVDILEKAANDVHELCLAAAQNIVDNNRFQELGIDERTAEIIRKSWNADELHLYGRFDFLYDGHGQPKMLEYNADTPTSLLEASVIQWDWLEDTNQKKDQFNSLHERLIARWKQMTAQGRIRGGIDRNVHFAALGDIEEDHMTAEYLRDTASQAGLDTIYIDVEGIGYREGSPEYFKGLQGEDITTLFKLYPWEWLMRDEFGSHIPTTQTRFIEPAWKMMWSNKGILPILWELNPNHPNLLPAMREQPKKIEGWVQKPVLGREGANISITGFREQHSREGLYGTEGYVYQEYHKIRPFDGNFPVLGVWMIGDECGGMGIRESDGPITDNMSRFTPHYFV